jgi:hypothetical protein
MACSKEVVVAVLSLIGYVTGRVWVPLWKKEQEKEKKKVRKISKRKRKKTCT